MTPVNPTPAPIHGTARVNRGRVEVQLSVPIDPAADADATDSSTQAFPSGPPAAEPGTATHSPGFACVNWYGVVYSFSFKQRLVVAALWQARDEGHPWLTQETLAEAAESDCSRIRDLFRRHPAWGTMIVSGIMRGGPPGSYRLAEMNERE